MWPGGPSAFSRSPPDSVYGAVKIPVSSSNPTAVRRPVVSLYSHPSLAVPEPAVTMVALWVYWLTGGCIRYGPYLPVASTVPSNFVLVIRFVHICVSDGYVS